MPGLINLGNTCYINTLIQCMGHVDCIRDWMIGATLNTSTLTAELADVWRKMWVDKQSLMPRRFVHFVCSKFGMDIGEQHDINELLMMFVDRLSSEDTSIVDIHTHAYPKHASSSNELKALYEKATNTWQAYHKKGFGKWDQMTEGLWISQIQCKHCNTYTHNFEPFTTLNFELSRESQNISLHDALHKHFISETVEEWKCDKCKVVAPAEKVMRIWKLPRVLTIVWKRFSFCAQSFRYQKIATSVSMPKELHFPRQYVLAPSSDMVYHLKSLGLHHGGMNYGHYTAIACVDAGSNPKWYHYDDDKVSEVSMTKNEEISSKDVYIAMYEMIPSTMPI